MHDTKVSFLPIKQSKGFTLAELLIALTILGVIATFTIPKILNTSQNQGWQSNYKEMMSAVANAYTMAIKDNKININTTPASLLNYFNYVSIDTSRTIDRGVWNGITQCDVSNPCLVLHNGGVLKVSSTQTFGQSNANNYISFYYDPDGKVSATDEGPGQSLGIDLYYNGRITSTAVRPAGVTTYRNGSPQSWGNDDYPDWFTDWQ